MAGKIFINYRRGDDPGHTGRLFDRLQDVFEPRQLFLDVDNIAPGLDFVRELNDRVAECDILLAVIGKAWIDVRNATGARRLDDPDDFVRIEIESALNQNKRVIPVLVGEAPMPRPDELPDTLKPLARRNAVRLTHERFRADTQGLIKALQDALGEIDAAHRKQAEAEAARRAEEAEQTRRSALEASERTAEDRRRQQAAAEQRAAEERAFTAAKRANTIAALDAFLAAYPAGPLAGDAQEFKDALLARAEEAERRKKAEIEAQERAAEERRRLQAAAEQRTVEERAFAAARRANTIAAVDAFIATYPAGDFAGDAQKLKAALLARGDAHRRAMASDDPALLRSFLDIYRKGDDAGEVRARLRLLEPRQDWRTSKPALIAGALAAVLLVGTVFVWVESKPPPQPAMQPAAIPAPSPQAADTSSKPASSISAAPVPGPDAVAWELLKDTTDSAALQRFIAQFPDSPLRKDAEARSTALAAAQAAQADAAAKAEQVAWNLVKDSKDPDQLRRFIQEFPNGAQRKDAEQLIATLPDATPATTVAKAPDPHELARSLQFELQRVGCFLGTVNGEFDDATKTAWHKFTKLTSISMPDGASSDAINAVRGVNTRVCPLACPQGQHAEGEICVANPPPPPRQATAAPVAVRPSALAPAETGHTGAACGGRRGRYGADGAKHCL
jgi:hypothetical protein